MIDALKKPVDTTLLFFYMVSWAASTELMNNLDVETLNKSKDMCLSLHSCMCVQIKVTGSSSVKLNAATCLGGWRVEGRSDLNGK